jgi:hypothetical protein
MLILVFPLADLNSLIHPLFSALLLRLNHRIEFSIDIVVEEKFGKVILLERGFLLYGGYRRLRGGCRARCHALVGASGLVG